MPQTRMGEDLVIHFSYNYCTTYFVCVLTQVRAHTAGATQLSTGEVGAAQICMVVFDVTCFGYEGVTAAAMTPALIRTTHA